MQPIHYSLLVNGVAMLIAGALSWKFSNPLVFIVALLLAQHTMARFGREEPDDDGPGGDYDGGNGVGFTPPQ